MAKPDLKWPAIYFAGAGVWIAKCIDSGETVGYALVPVFALLMIGAVGMYRDTLRARAQWRHDRLVAWLKRPLPDPDAVDPNENAKVAR